MLLENYDKQLRNFSTITTTRSFIDGYKMIYTEKDFYSGVTSSNNRIECYSTYITVETEFTEKMGSKLALRTKFEKYLIDIFHTSNHIKDYRVFIKRATGYLFPSYEYTIIDLPTFQDCILLLNNIRDKNLDIIESIPFDYMPETYYIKHNVAWCIPSVDSMDIVQQEDNKND